MLILFAIVLGCLELSIHCKCSFHSMVKSVVMHLAIKYVLLQKIVMQCRTCVGELDGDRYSGQVQPQDDMSNNKIFVIYCAKDTCYSGTCYCCEGIPDAPCYSDLKDCQNICPICDPHCKPPPKLPLLLPPLGQRQVRRIPVSSSPSTK